MMGSRSASRYPIPGPGKSMFVSVCIPRDHIPLLASFSWHSQGLHPSLSYPSPCILRDFIPLLVSFFWHLQGLHPVLTHLEMSLLAAGG